MQKGGNMQIPNLLGMFRHILILMFIFSVIFIAGCDYLSGGGGIEDIEEEMADGGEEVRFGAARHIQWLPWYLAETDAVFQRYSEEYSVNIVFQAGDYDNLIHEFESGELGAIAITNIDALIHLVRLGIQADAILISSYSYGNDAVLLPKKTNTNIMGQTIAVKENSSAHYLLERYLLKNQIEFTDVEKQWATTDEEIETLFDTGEVAGVATWNPLADKLKREKEAVVLFNSHSVPREISHLLVIRRGILKQNPNVGKALLATWFTVMEGLQGNRRSATMDALAEIAELPRPVFDSQFASLQMADNATKALSVLRDRSMRKTMRHIRFFMERHELVGEVPVGSRVSYPGRTPALIHFNAKPLQKFLAPPEADVLL
jgi:NitT/TauT family transport system substrate-binding protein